MLNSNFRGQRHQPQSKSYLVEGLNVFFPFQGSGLVGRIVQRTAGVAHIAFFCLLPETKPYPAPALPERAVGDKVQTGKAEQAGSHTTVSWVTET